MYGITDEKKRLRAFYAARRKELKDVKKDGEICKYARLLQGSSFFVYDSFGSEADTHAIIQYLLSAGKTVCLPRICGNDMIAVNYAGGPLKKGAFGLSEPPEGKDVPCEVALVPLLAVDKEGTRLGWGGGYYDRYFASHENTFRVGLCFKGQIADRLPREEHDMRLHAIVTEEGFQNLTAYAPKCIIEESRNGKKG